MEILRLDRPPYLRVWRDFLAPDICDELLERAQGRFTRSAVMNGAGEGQVINDVRTSDGAYLSIEEGAVVLDQVAALTGTPRANWETPQVLRYGVGGEYRPHHDWLYPEHPSSIAALRRGGQRVGSFLLGLQPAEEGGETVFPDVGVKVKLGRGDAAFFWYPQPNVEGLSLHGSTPVVRGTKFIVPAWCRINEFDSAWPDLRVVDEAINADDCARLIEHYAASPARAGGVDQVVQPDATFIAPFVAHVARIAREQFGGGQFVLDTVLLARMEAGSAMHNHADNVLADGSPNHTPQRTHTAVLMLDDGPGGATVYGDNPIAPKYERRVERKRGRLHMSVAGPSTWHRVETTGAPRHSLAIWFRGQQ